MKSCDVGLRGPRQSISTSVASSRAIAQIAADRIVEEIRLLRHDADVRAQRLRASTVAHVDAVDEDAAALRIVEARHELRDRRLARARGARRTRPLGPVRSRNRRRRSAVRVRACSAKWTSSNAIIAAHVFEHVPRARRAVRPSTFGLRHVEIFEDAFEDGERADDLDLHAGERRGGPVQPAEQRDEGDDRADRDRRRRRWRGIPPRATRSRGRRSPSHRSRR